MDAAAPLLLIRSIPPTSTVSQSEKIYKRNVLSFLVNFILAFCSPRVIDDFHKRRAMRRFLRGGGFRKRNVDREESMRINLNSHKLLFIAKHCDSHTWRLLGGVSSFALSLLFLFKSLFSLSIFLSSPTLYDLIVLIGLRTLLFWKRKVPRFVGE